MDEPRRLGQRGAGRLHGHRVVGRVRRSPASSTSCPRRAGVQFHPEVGHTRHGQAVLEHFLYDIAGIEPTWTPESIVEQQVAAIRAQVGDKEVICGLSGGVDSAVAAALVHRAVGDQLTCVFVDHGLLRAGRGRAGREGLRRRDRHQAQGRRRVGALPGRAGRRVRPGAEAEDHRA